MTFESPVLFFLCSIGVFNGFLASFYFLFFSKEKRVQNLFFGFLLLMLSLRIGKSVYVIFTESEERNLLLLQIGLSACLFGQYLGLIILGFGIIGILEFTKQSKKVMAKTIATNLLYKMNRIYLLLC